MNSPPSASRRRSVSTSDIKNNATNEGETKTAEGNVNKKQKTTATEQDSSNIVIDKKLVQSLIKPTLYRLTEGLPRHELKLMENEAKECEAALLEEIRILEQTIGINTKSATPDKKKSEEAEERTESYAE